MFGLQALKNSPSQSAGESATRNWQSVIDCLNGLLSTLKDNFVCKSYLCFYPCKSGLYLMEVDISGSTSSCAENLRAAFRLYKRSAVQ